MRLYQQVGIFNEKPVYRHLHARNAGSLRAILGFRVNHCPKSVKSLDNATTTTTDRRGHPYSTSSEEHKF